MIQTAFLALAFPAAADQDTLLSAIPGPLTAQSQAQLGFSVAIDGSLTAVGAFNDDTGAVNAGVVKIFDSDTGDQLHFISNPSPAEGDFFGNSISLSGTWLLVGAPQDSTNATGAGSAYLYDLSGESPVLAHTFNNPAAAAFDEFGFSVAVSGSKLVVGAYRNDTGASNAGRAYVYDLNSGTPTTPVVTIDNPTPVASDLFGRSVAISGNLVIVGAHQNDTGASNAGSAYVFDLDGPTPSSPTYVLSNPVPLAQDFFGIAVAISGTRVAVGASGKDTGAPNTGSTYFYDLAGVEPTTPLATINNPSPGDGDAFGRALAISGTRLLIGADAAKVGGINAGVAYVYDVTGGTPTLLHTLENPAPGADDLFARSVSISGTGIAVGAPNDDTGATNAGSAYLYDLGSETPTVPVAALNDPGPASGNRFGDAVAVSGRWLVASSPYADLGAINAGVVYVFDLAGATPGQPLYTLLNPAPVTNDYFGSSVAISGSKVLVGVPYQDTGATNSGTVYVYDIEGGTPEDPILTVHNPVPVQNDYFGWSVSISGNLALVGAPYQDTGATDTGCAYVYDLGGGTPTVPVGTINNPTPAVNDWFGWSIGISGELAVIGAYNDNTGATNAGSAYVYDLAGGTSTLLHTLNNPDAAEFDFFGASVAISGSQVLVAAPNANSAVVNSGSAYFYELSSATPESPAVTLNNPSPASDDFFGTSVAISESRVLIGVPNKDNGGTDTGLAYVYDIHSATPAVPLATLEKLDPSEGGYFGFVVAISGKTCAIGMPNADSQSNPLIFDTGSVFAFGPAAQIALDGPSGSALRNNGPAINAGEVLVGDGGEVLTFTIRNNGILDIEGIAVDLEGPDSTDFLLDAGTTATSLAPGATTTFTVSFAPNATGTREANLSIASINGDENPFITPLAGTGVLPVISVSVSPASVTEDGTADLVYTFTRSGVLSNEVTVAFDVGGSALFDDDYTQSGADSFSQTAGTVVFAAASTTATVTISPTADSEVEVDETVILTVASGSGYTIGTPDSATGTILNDDTAVSVAVSPESVTEDSNNDLVYTFTRSGVISNELTVAFDVGGSALFDTDYTQSGADTFSPTAGTVTFIADSSTATVTISPTADSDVEADETVILTVASGSGYAIGAPESATGTILNDDTESEPTPRDLFDAFVQAVGLAGADAEPNATPVNDGVSNLIKYAFNMNASGPDTTVLVPTTGTTGLPVLLYIGGNQPDVHYEYIRRKNSGLTYTPLQSTTLAAGSWEPMTGTLTVTDIDEIWERVVILQDHDPENTPKRFFRVEVVLGDAFVIDEDPLISITVTPESVTEDGTDDMVFTFTRNGVISNELTVAFDVGGSALFDDDYTQTGADSFSAAAGTVTFAAESTTATVTISPTADSVVEDDETIILTIASGSGYAIGTPDSATGTILNDDTAPTPRDLFDAFVQAAGLAGADAEPNAIPFNDGVSNLIKYAFNMNASGPDTRVLVPTTGTAGLPVLLYIGGNQPDVHYEFIRRKNSGLTYTPLQSTTLAAGSWEPMTGTFTVTDIDESWERVVILQDHDPEDTPKRFFRVEVVLGDVIDEDPLISISVTPESVTEDGTDDLVFTFTRSGVTDVELTVAFDVGGTALFDDDYTQTGADSFLETAGTVIFAADSTTATVTISPTADSVVEDDETIILTIASGSGYAIGTPDSATGTILNDDTESTPSELFDAFALAAGLTGPDAEPDATPFNDGVSNLIKYASNMDASGPDTRVLVPTTGTVGLPVLLHTGGNEPDVRYEFLRRKNSGLTYSPLQSATLAGGSWEPMTGTITVTYIDETWERVVILHGHDPVNTPKHFFKMGVTLG